MSSIFLIKKNTNVTTQQKIFIFAYIWKEKKNNFYIIYVNVW